MKKIEIQPEKITVVRSKHSTDHICISFSGTSPWLSELFMDYDPLITIEVAAGYAEDWLRDNFNLNPEDYEIVEHN